MNIPFLRMLDFSDMLFMSEFELTFLLIDL